MNQNKRLKRRIILSSFMLIIICSVFSLQSTEPVKNLIFFTEPTQLPISSAFEGTGKHFNVTQHATAISSTYDVNPTTTSEFTLTNGWTAENIIIECENVTRQQDFVYDGIIDHYDYDPYSNWFYQENDNSGVDALNPDYRPSILSLDVGEGGNMPAGDWAYFNQTVTVDDEEVTDRLVELSFDYRIRNNYGAYLGASIYGAVIVGGVEHNVTYGFGSLYYNNFYTINLQYYLPDEGQSLPNDIEFRVGVYIQSSTTYNGDNNDVHFDNIAYNVWTWVNEPNFLVAEDNDDFTDYYYQNSSVGMGNFTITGQKNYVGTQDVSFTIRDSTTDVVLIDKLTISADLTNSTYSTYSSFQDGAFANSDDILWSFEIATLIPGSYLDRTVIIEKPTDWEIISIVDPFLTNRTTSCTDTEYGTTDFIIPPSVFSSGDWEIRARSKSWFDEAKLEFWNGATFEEKTEYYIGEDFHVKVNINDTVTLTNTYINFTIYNPNGSVYYEESEEPSSFEYYFGNFTVGLNMTTGLYTAEVAWTNNQTPNMVDKVGYKTFDFGVFHRTQLSAVDNLIDTVPGEPLIILVTYEDTDTGSGIDLATVEYNSTYGDSGQLTYLGSGYYFLELDTTSYDYTDYYLSFNASKNFYQNHTISNLIQLNIEREGMVLDVPRQVNSVSANSYAQFNFNLTGEISETFLSADDLTTDWAAWYEINPLALGQYELNVSTWGVTSGSFPETFVINIFANKTNYTNTSDVVLLQVNPIATDLFVDETFIQVSQGDTFNITVDYIDSSGGTRVPNSFCNVTWERSYTKSNSSDGFEIEFETTGLDLDQYTIAIMCNSSGYESQTKFITVLVEPIYTNMTLDENFIQVSQGNAFNITIDYTDELGGVRVPNSICEITWGKPHITSNTISGFETEFSTTGLNLGQYIITIKCSSSGYETKTAFVTVLVEPVPTSMLVSEPIVIVTQGDTFNITIDYTENSGTTRVPYSTCNITWGNTHTISNTSNGFEVELSTTGLELGQYIATILCYSSGYTTQSYFVTVLIEPITTTISISNVTVLTYSDRTFNITVDYEEEISGNPVIGADIMITWIGTYSYVSTGTGFEITFNTTGISVGQYLASIQVNRSGWESQNTFVIVQINDLPSNLELTSEIEFTKGDQVIISVNFIVDGVVFSAGTVQIIGDIEGTLLWNGTDYVFEIDSSNLDPQIYFCRIIAQATGVQTSELEIFVNIKPIDRNLNLAWWIAGSVSGTVLLGLMSLFVFNRYIKQTRFQRDVAFIQKNIANPNKIKSRSEPDREKMVSEIINKEIDQLL